MQIYCAFYAQRHESCPILLPLAGVEAGFAGKNTGKDSGRGEAALLGYLLYFHLRMFVQEPLRFFDAVTGDELIERTIILGFDEAAEVGSVKRQDLLQVMELEVRIAVRLFGIHPFFERRFVRHLGRIKEKEPTEHAGDDDSKAREGGCTHAHDGRRDGAGQHKKHYLPYTHRNQNGRPQPACSDSFMVNKTQNGAIETYHDGSNAHRGIDVFIEDLFGDIPRQPRT